MPTWISDDEYRERSFDCPLQVRAARLHVHVRIWDTRRWIQNLETGSLLFENSAHMCLALFCRHARGRRCYL